MREKAEEIKTTTHQPIIFRSEQNENKTKKKFKYFHWNHSLPFENLLISLLIFGRNSLIICERKITLRRIFVLLLLFLAIIDLCGDEICWFFSPSWMPLLIHTNSSKWRNLIFACLLSIVDTGRHRFLFSFLFSDIWRVGMFYACGMNLIIHVKHSRNTRCTVVSGVYRNLLIHLHS